MWRPLLCLALAACSCPTVARNAVNITLRDAQSRVVVCDAVVRVEDGDYRAQLSIVGCSYAGAMSRAGTYTVIIDHPKYRSKVVSGVEVEPDSCGNVETKAVEVLIDPR